MPPSTNAMPPSPSEMRPWTAPGRILRIALPTVPAIDLMPLMRPWMMALPALTSHCPALENALRMFCGNCLTWFHASSILFFTEEANSCSFNTIACTALAIAVLMASHTAWVVALIASQALEIRFLMFSQVEDTNPVNADHAPEMNDEMAFQIVVTAFLIPSHTPWMMVRIVFHTVVTTDVNIVHAAEKKAAIPFHTVVTTVLMTFHTVWNTRTMPFHTVCTSVVKIAHAVVKNSWIPFHARMTMFLMPSQAVLKMLLTNSQLVWTCALYASHAVANHSVMAVQALEIAVLMPSHACETVSLTAFHFSENHSGIPFHTSTIVCHASCAQVLVLSQALPKNSVKSAQIFLPVSVWVKNQTRPATIAAITATAAPNGFAEIAAPRVLKPPAASLSPRTKPPPIAFAADAA